MSELTRYYKEEDYLDALAKMQANKAMWEARVNAFGPGGYKSPSADLGSFKSRIGVQDSRIQSLINQRLQAAMMGDEPEVTDINDYLKWYQTGGYEPYFSEGTMKEFQNIADQQMQRGAHTSSQAAEARAAAQETARLAGIDSGIKVDNFADTLFDNYAMRFKAGAGTFGGNDLIVAQIHDDINNSDLTPTEQIAAQEAVFERLRSSSPEITRSEDQTQKSFARQQDQDLKAENKRLATNSVVKRYQTLLDAEKDHAKRQEIIQDARLNAMQMGADTEDVIKLLTAGDKDAPSLIEAIDTETGEIVNVTLRQRNAEPKRYISLTAADGRVNQNFQFAIISSLPELPSPDSAVDWPIALELMDIGPQRMIRKYIQDETKLNRIQEIIDLASKKNISLAQMIMGGSYGGGSSSNVPDVTPVNQ